MAARWAVARACVPTCVLTLVVRGLACTQAMKTAPCEEKAPKVRVEMGVRRRPVCVLCIAREAARARRAPVVERDVCMRVHSACAKNAWQKHANFRGRGDVCSAGLPYLERAWLSDVG